VPAKKISSPKTSKAKVANKKPSGRTTREKTYKSMDELLAAHGDKTAGLAKGQEITGMVREITSKSVIIDIDGKSEGLVAERAFKEAKEYIKTLKIGDTVKAKVLVPETSDGYTILSLRDSAQKSTWEKLESSMKNSEPVSVFVKSSSRSGLSVEYLGMHGFVPGSQLGSEVVKKIDKLVGRNLDVVVIDYIKDTRKVIFSEKLVSEKDEIDRIKKAIAALKVGDKYPGKITTVENFGVFVEINVGKAKTKVEGLVHVSELSWAKIDKPRDSFSQDDEIEVKVIGKDGGKLALSAKQAEKDPWETKAKKYVKDGKYKGKIVKRSDFGTFVELEPGIEGLIHMTKIPPGTKLDKGDEINVYIEDIDQKSRKISLGIVLTAKPMGYK